MYMLGFHNNMDPRTYQTDEAYTSIASSGDRYGLELQRVGRQFTWR